MIQPQSSRSNSAFISYPKQAAFGRVLPKNKIYERSGANTRLKDLFVEQVEQIIWQYKLAPETINLPSKTGVLELQVFSIQLKTPELNLDVLRCIDGAVQFPIIFELLHEGRIKVVACYKRPNEADSGKWVCSEYFETDWLNADIDRNPMPMVLDLGALYEWVLKSLIPLQPRPEEVMADLVTRTEQVQAKQREITRIVNKLAREKQFNRKVEINAELRRLKVELDDISR